MKKVGGTIEDTELIEGLALNQTVMANAGGPTRMEKARIGLIQFQLSSPKPDVSFSAVLYSLEREADSFQMDNQIVVNDYRQMDKILKEERQYLLNLCKRIKKTGCNVLLIQKSILRDAVTDLSLHFLAKLKIVVIKDIERDEIEFISKSTGAKPVADIEAFTEDKLGYAELVEENTSNGGAKVVKVTGVKNPGKTVSVVCTGANSLVLEESERSLHDALCVVRCLVKKRSVHRPLFRSEIREIPTDDSADDDFRALIAGGGAPEIHVSRLLTQYAQTLKGKEAYCFQAFAESLEVIPTTLAENAGLNPISIVTELRNKHALGERNAGINVKKVSSALNPDLSALLAFIVNR